LKNTTIKTLTAGILIVLGLASSVAAHAETAGFYLKADGGVVSNSLNKNQIDAEIADSAIVTALSGTDVGFDLRAGYHFNSIVGLDVGYAHLGNIEYSLSAGGESASITVRNQAFLTNVVLSAPLGTDMSVDARIGTYHMATRANVVTPIGSLSASESTTNLVAGLGLSYAMTAHWGLHTDWTHFANVASVAGVYGVDKANLDLITLGASYRF
jgi:opacity protein-like surface antigen